MCSFGLMLWPVLPHQGEKETSSSTAVEDTKCVTNTTLKVSLMLVIVVVILVAVVVVVVVVVEVIVVVQFYNDILFLI